MMDTDTKSDTALEPEDDAPARFSGRRIARWVLVLAVGILAVLAVWQDPVHALGL
jgi:hypothetical protein